MRRSILASAFLSVLFSLLVISCSSHDSSTSTTSESSDALTALAAIAVPASDTMTIGNYVLVSKVRYGRTAYDYTFRASMSNSGSQYAQDVRAVLFSSVQTTVVISGALDFGDIAPGETVQSQNTFTVRIDRLYAFNEADLLWDIQAAFPEAVGMIDSSGGTVEVTDPQSSLNGTVISLPAGALAEDTSVSVNEVFLSSSLPQEVVNAGPIVDIGPDGTQFNQPVEVTLPYDDKDDDGIIDNCDIPEDQITVKTYNTTTRSWEDVQIVSQDIDDNTVTILTNHFSVYVTCVPSKASDRNVVIFVVDGLNFRQLILKANSYYLSLPNPGGPAVSLISSLIRSILDNEIETYYRPSYLKEALESECMDLGLLKSDIKYFDGSCCSACESNGGSWNGDPEETTDLVNNLRRALRNEWLMNGGEGKKFIIVSHSWGTVLAQLALSYEMDIKPDLFITLSSPLGSMNADPPNSFVELYYSSCISNYSYGWIDKTRDALGEPERSISSLGYDMKWINYWANGDMISGPLNLLQCDDEKVDRSTSPIYRNLDNTHLWHAVTSLSKVKMDEEDDYNPSGESIYEEYGVSFIEKVKQQLQSIIGYLEHDTYEIIDLGTFGSPTTYDSSSATSINNSGQVVGKSLTRGGASRAFLYTDGIMMDLGTVNNQHSLAYDINDSGQVVGGTSDIFGGVAFLYSGDSMVDLGVGKATAHGINNNGQIVGGFVNASGYGQAFLYDNGNITEIGTIFGTQYSRAYDINDNGQVVGSFRGIDSNHDHAFLYSDGEMIDLGTLDGYDTSCANAINNNGQIVGYIRNNTNGICHAFLYSNGRMVDIGALPGDTNCYANDINDMGQVVGYSQGRAFLYSCGRMVDLNLLIDINSGWDLYSAQGINNKGQIVGYGKHNGSTRAFLMTPKSL